MTSIQQTSSSKQHYVILDFLRGIAALIVLIFHYTEYTNPDFTKNLVAHGFLAVDFFFCLSGFVIGYAYDDRMKGMGIKQFFTNRLIRLHPLVILGSVLGIVLYFVFPWSSDALAPGWGNIVLATVLSLLLIPSNNLLNSASTGVDRPDLFPLNSASWSLFFEYIANIFYAFALCRIKRGWLIPIAVLGAGWLGLLGSKTGILVGGWDISTFWVGMARVTFSFTAGLLIFKYNLVIRHKMGALLPTGLLLVALMFPHLDKDWLTELACVVLLCPLIVSLGAGTSGSGRLQGVYEFVGRMSYPVYIMHYPVVVAFGNYYLANKPEGTPLVMMVVALILLNLAIAYASLRWFDEPVRRWLAAQNKKRRAQKAA